MYRRALILVGVLFSVCLCTLATTRYVDGTLGADCTSGNYSIAARTCTGSDGNAYNTMDEATDLMVAGDITYVRAHSFTGAGQDWGYDGGNGTSWSNAPQIRNYNSEVVWLRTASFGGTQHASYIIVHGIYLNGQLNGTPIDQMLSMQRVASGTPFGTDHLRWEDGKFKGPSTLPANPTSIGVACGNANSPYDDNNYSEFLRNEFYDFVVDPNSPMYLSCGHILIDGDTFHDNAEEAFQFYPQSTTNVVRNNTFYNNNKLSTQPDREDPVIICCYGNNNQIYNNILYCGTCSSEAFGISIFNGTNNAVYNNTVYGFPAGGGAGIDIGSAASGTLVKNNISYGNSTNYTNLGSGTVAATNSFDGTNPLFDNFTSLHLTASSACCIDTGTNLTSIFTADIDGQSRPSGGGLWDEGADEFIAADSPPAGCSGGAEVATFDAETSSGLATNASSITVAHTAGTCGPVDGLAIATTHIYHATDADGATPTGITYGGVAMTKIDSVGNTAEGMDTSEWRYKLPPNSSQNVIATLGLSARVIMTVTTYCNVNQTTPIGTAVKSTVGASGTSSSLAVTSATNEIVHDGITTWCTASCPTITVGAGQTERWNLQQVDGYFKAAGSTEPGAASVTMSHSFSNSQGYCHVAVPIKNSSTVCGGGDKMMLGMVGDN